MALSYTDIGVNRFECIVGQRLFKTFRPAHFADDPQWVELLYSRYIHDIPAIDG
jgi:hypothetical protein